MDIKETGLTPVEAGALIGCSAYTIKELARRKKIPHYRVGARYMFTRSSLLKWMADQEEKNYIKKAGGNENGKR